ncbi:hypothetical protein HYX01_02575 [Candidatus Woesearchaeota archaeon]|nr:hypothetical protein [Candidatus Woesearchaeota archaeon]
MTFRISTEPVLQKNLNASIKEVILEYSLIAKEDLEKILSPKEMTQPKEPDKELINKIKSGKGYMEFLSRL